MDPFGLVNQLKQNTVVTAAGKFEEHPEAYRPRIFVRCPEKCYEILQDGQAVVWPGVPDKSCGFDFWVIKAKDVHDMTMVRGQNA